MRTRRTKNSHGKIKRFRSSVGPTSVSTANGGCQFSGGMIRQIPYFLPSGAIFFMYSRGSLNSSSVGRKVGASGRPWGRTRLRGSRGALGCPRRSTVDRSRGADRRALNGTLCECDGCVLEVRVVWRLNGGCEPVGVAPAAEEAVIFFTELWPM